MLHSQRCFETHLGPWAIELGWFYNVLAAIKNGLLLPIRNDENGRLANQAVERAARMDVGASQVRFDQRGYVLYEVRGGVGVVEIHGPMMKFDSKYGGTNTIRTRQSVRAAVQDQEVSAILLRIESPGGSVAGTAELAADVAEAATKKKTVAYIEDLGASAAYWVAAAAGKVFSNEMALVGSIGTVAVLEDSSKMADIQGVKVHVVSTGGLKGAGTPGTPITEEMIGKAKQIVDAFGDRFFAAIKDARGLDAKGLQSVSTGEVWVAKQARALGLIDGVKSFDQVLLDLAGKKSYSRQNARASIEIEENS